MSPKYMLIVSFLVSFPGGLPCPIALAAGEELQDAGSIALEFPRGSAVWMVAEPQTPLEHRLVDRLGQYLQKVLGEPVRWVDRLADCPPGSPAFVLTRKTAEEANPAGTFPTTDESFTLATGRIGDRSVVLATATTDVGLKRAVQRLILKSEQREKTLFIPRLNLQERPWIPRREWTLCPWVPQVVALTFYNPFADSRLNIFQYDRQRLSDYVEMFDWFGFSGCQLMETSYTYTLLSSIERTHEFQKMMAELLRENGQNVTLWAWAAEFSIGDWIDPEIVYKPQPGKTAFEDPAVRRCFEKYYDHYARLAPFIDLFIAHFFDPGRLENEEDVYNYMRLLETKLKAKNPNLRMGIDGWAKKADYMLDLSRNGFNDYLILPTTIPHAYPAGVRENMHREAAKLNMNMGIWGWYTTEYETDQLASMYVNAQVLKNVYQTLKNGALAIHPVVYWSEMEAHHLNDIYSMYVAGRLLWNPEEDPHALLNELTGAIWGPVNGPKALAALELIQDVRSGPTWDTYWWTSEKHRVGTGDAAADLNRAREALAALENMKPDAGFIPKLPLPWPPETFVDLMLPHLRQIKLYCEFLLKVEEIRKAAAAGASRDTLEKMAVEAWQPVPEYDTWIGSFSTKEVRQQKDIIISLRKELGLKIPDPAWFRRLETDRVLQYLRRMQRYQPRPIRIDLRAATKVFFWPKDYGQDRFNALIEEGLLIPMDENGYQLADWQNWARR